jgi:ketosteroid isomerase-like protein
MSQENVDAYRQAIDAINSGDIEAWLRFVDPDVTFEPLRSPVQGAYSGHRGLREWFADTVETFDSFRIDHADIRDLGDDRVLAIGTLHVRGKGSGIETDVPTAAIASFRDGGIVSFKDYGDPAAALEAAGLAE